MIVLEPRNLSWLNNFADPSLDLCAHGKVYFEIDGKVLVNEQDGEWTVSASALRLLRSLELEHKQECMVNKQIFPCCGFNFLYKTGWEFVHIPGCPNGIDFEITHHENNILISSYNGLEPILVSLDDWRKAVVHFSERVMRFYSISEPRNTEENINKLGFEKFMAEWKRRNEEAIRNLE